MLRVQCGSAAAVLCVDGATDPAAIDAGVGVNTLSFVFNVQALLRSCALMGRLMTNTSTAAPVSSGASFMQLEQGPLFSESEHQQKLTLEMNEEGRKTMIAPTSVWSHSWMASIFILFLVAGRLMDANRKPDSRERSTLERPEEQKLNAEYGVLSITDQILLTDLGDVLASRTDRSADTEYLITAVDLSPDVKTVYYAENAAIKTNTSDSTNKTVTVAVWKAEWVEGLQSYNVSHLAGGWPVLNEDPTKPTKDSGVAGLLMLDGGYLLVSQKHNDRIEKLEVTTGKSIDKWTLEAPLGLAKHPAQDAFFASSGDRINKISLTVPSFWGSVDVIADSGRELVQSDGSSGSLMAMALTTDDRYLFAGTGDGRIIKLETNVSALHLCGLAPLPAVDSGKSSTSRNMSRVMIFVGVALGCAMLVLGAGVCAMYAICGFKHGQRSVIPPPDMKITESSTRTRTGSGSGISVSLPSSFDPLLPTVVQEISLSVIQMAIKNGTCLHGKSGAYGDVYRASLMVGKKMVDVAIKVMKGEINEMKHKRFRAEVNTLSSVRHRHLCKLIGFCTEGNKFILVYPFISGGSLYDRLHECKHTTGKVSEESETMDSVGSCNLPLTWTERMSIARQIATCLRSLHHEADHPILHRDVKSRNVLVEGEGKSLHAYLADFGLARPGSCRHSDETPSLGQTTVPTFTRSGTPGYMPPEYIYESKLTMSSDVFAFGVVLLELVTGMHAVIKINEADSIPLYLLVRQRHGKEVLVENALSVSLTSEECVMADAVVKLALHCTEDIPSQRPDMGQVVQEILDTVKRANCAGDPRAPAGHTFLHPLNGPFPR
ncbi:hypothetical protein CBR_g36420 [Chara braunii]|uniref:Protein kinase domain-containing protein n=1 Tax=Chara braunii TaxID=69332 RepID=A0A388LKY3_CHABU|nr:hypothetical protein CBR_g36420 [Chara braunii]|eukprot:GBG82893.1 hypothetical protein CBR_g36420 [Chara braunii]